MVNMNAHKVFVYGTLKKGFNNHDLIAKSKFLGNFETGPGYIKVVKGLPCLMHKADGPGCSGELYEVSALTLRLLDRFEGHPDLYKRTLIKVYKPEKDIGIDAWVYLMPEGHI